MSARRAKGFSLLELIVVLAVLGVLLGVGGIFLSQFLAEKRLEEAAVSLSAALRRAADQAQTQSQSVTLSAAERGLSWQGEAGETLGAAALPSGATLTPAATVVFSGRGLPQTRQSFTVSFKSEVKTVHLLPTGAVIIR